MPEININNLEGEKISPPSHRGAYHNLTEMWYGNGFTYTNKSADGNIQTEENNPPAQPPPEQPIDEEKRKAQEAEETELLKIAQQIYGYESVDAVIDSAREGGSIAPSVEIVRQRGSLFPKKGIPGVPSYDRTMDIYNALPEGKLKHYFLLAYVYGARVTEILTLRRMDFRKAVDSKYGEYIEATLLNEKKRGASSLQVTRDLRLFKDIEPKLFADLNEYVERFAPEMFVMGKYDRFRAHHDMHSIDFGPIRATQRMNGKTEVVIRDHFPGYPHYLRHCRLTHLVNTFNFTIHDLVNYAGWANMNPAKFYVRSSVQEQGRAFFSVKG